MRRLLTLAGVALLAALALPPLWCALFPQTAPELPPAGRRVVLASGGVNVVERGSGEPVVLVHGLPGSAYDWRLLQDALAARGRRVLAYDRVGYGRSDARVGTPFSVEQNAAELVELLEALELRDATVVGWSYGGGTSMLAARRDPSRMARLVLVGSAGPGIEAAAPPRLLGAVMLSDPMLAYLRAVPPAARAVQRANSVQAFSGQPAPDWWLPSLEANFARPATLDTWRGEIRGLDGPVPEPTGIELPVLVVHGDDDRLAPLAVGRELHRLAAHSQLRVVEGGSHMLPITHAAWLADAIAGL